jgi:LuxR family maltose regulon positive regulatory protein
MRVRQPALVGGATPEPLSDSELAVLRLLPAALSNRQIGEELYISVNTVKTHLRSIYAKLGSSSREQAVGRARELGLI